MRDRYLEGGYVMGRLDTVEEIVKFIEAHSDSAPDKAESSIDSDTETFDLRLPLYFWLDHQDRCDDHGCREVVPERTNSRFAYVSLTEAQIADLRNDAEWYVDQRSYLDPQVAGQISGWAKSMLNALERQGH